MAVQHLLNYEIFFIHKFLRVRRFAYALRGTEYVNTGLVLTFFMM